ncbi:hypothetical protein D046_8223B, partial [Vibrio parahaemolyticus V-223/04]
IKPLKPLKRPNGDFVRGRFCCVTISNATNCTH